MAVTYHWEQLAMLGDQFLVLYSQVASNTPAATLFNVGHAAELYLKAVAIRTNPTARPSSFNHGVASLLRMVQSQGLLTNYQMNDQFRDRFMGVCPHPIELMQDADYCSYIANQELYWVAYYLADLKYLGTEHKRAPDIFGLTVMCCNPYWIPFFSELRGHLGWPQQGRYFDFIEMHMEHGQVGTHAAYFLSKLSPSGAYPATNAYAAR